MPGLEESPSLSSPTLSVVSVLLGLKEEKVFSGTPCPVTSEGITHMPVYENGSSWSCAVGSLHSSTQQLHENHLLLLLFSGKEVFGEETGMTNTVV